MARGREGARREIVEAAVRVALGRVGLHGGQRLENLGPPAGSRSGGESFLAPGRLFAPGFRGRERQNGEERGEGGCGKGCPQPGD
jgi:hypothetical protein